MYSETCITRHALEDNYFCQNTQCVRIKSVKNNENMELKMRVRVWRCCLNCIIFVYQLCLIFKCFFKYQKVIFIPHEVTDLLSAKNKYVPTSLPYFYLGYLFMWLLTHAQLSIYQNHFSLCLYLRLVSKTKNKTKTWLCHHIVLLDIIEKPKISVLLWIHETLS